MSERSDQVYIYQECNKELRTCDVAYAMWRVYPPMFVALGTIGNILCFLVLIRRRMRAMSITVHLLFLSVFDLLVLYSGLVRSWQQYAFDYDFRTSNPASCKIGVWVFATSTACSFWVLAFVTIERVIAVRFPIFAKVHLSRKTTLISLIVLVAFIGSTSLHTLISFSVVDVDVDSSEDASGTVVEDVSPHCIPIGKQYEEFVNVYWPWLVLITYSLAPFLVILIGNIIVAATLISMKRKTKRRVFPIGTISKTTSAVPARKTANSSRTMLFALSGFFLVATMPICVYVVIYAYTDVDASEETRAVSEVTWAVVNVLFYSNNTFNFLLYALTGATFRAELKAMGNDIYGALRRAIGKQQDFALPRLRHNTSSRTTVRTPQPA